MSTNSRVFSRLDRLQVGVLVAAAPFLLFPTVSSPATALAAALIAAVLLLRWRIEGAAPVTPINGALTVWLAMVAVGAGVTAFPDLTLPKLTGILLGALVWLTITQTVRTPRQLTWARWGFAVAGLGLAGLGALTTNWPSKIPGLETLSAQLPSALLALPNAPDAGVHANELGGALVPYLPLALSLLIGSLSPTVDCKAPSRTVHARARPHLLPALTSLAAAGILLLSQSRSAWIGALVSTAVVIALWVRLLALGKLRKILGAGLLLGLATGVAGALWLGPSGLQRLWDEPAQLAAVGGTNTLSFRFEVWRWALMAVQDFLFTGCGLGAFREVGRLLYPLNIAVNYDFAHAHNIFLQVALDTGVPGLIAYLAILGITLRVAWQTACRQTACRYLAHRAWALGLLGGLVALHTFGLTDALAPGSKPGLIFWTMLGLITAAERLSREAEGRGS